MSKAFYRGLLSATSKKEAIAILDILTKKKMIAGGLITSGESQYWWKGKRVRKTYYNLSVFTVGRKRRQIMAVVNKTQKDEVPIIAFFKIDGGNKDFLDWIKTSVNN